MLSDSGGQHGFHDGILLFEGANSSISVEADIPEDLQHAQILTLGSFVATRSSADFDGDGDVDAEDMLRWQANFGSGATQDAGDANGDGLDDLIVGANGGDPDGKEDAGESYVIFGRSSDFPATF